MGRTLKFRVPKQVLRRPQALVTSDRAATLPLLFDIRKETNLYEPETPPPGVFRVLEKFGRPSTSLLHIPRNLQPDPFTYFCTENLADESYVTEPRLLVTKLLTDAWCELQLFYDVYAGLHRKQLTGRLAEGISYHDKLESEEHEVADMSATVEKLGEVAASHTKEDALYLGRNELLAAWCKNMAEHAIKRGISLAHTRHSRELMVHGYIDLETGKLIEKTEDLHKGVLVNGIADIVQFEPKDKATDLPEVASDTTEAPELRSITLASPVLDLKREIPEAKRELQRDIDQKMLQIIDVKTRGVKSLPKPVLQLKAAKIQCMYYTRFIHNLAKDVDFAYASYQENAKRRNIDADSDIGEAHAAILLLENFEALALDFIRLAKGETIGFESHDAVMKEKYREVDAEKVNYSFSRFIPEEEFKDLLAKVYGDKLASSSVDISALFKPWRYPLTPRYFMARAAQILNTLERYRSATVGVDYHHAKSSTFIGSKVYPYSVKEHNKAMRDAANFWTGKRLPREADLKFKCQNCEFKSRCPAVNKPSKESIGALIYHDLLD